VRSVRQRPRRQARLPAVAVAGRTPTIESADELRIAVNSASDLRRVSYVPSPRWTAAVVGGDEVATSSLPRPIADERADDPVGLFEAEDEESTMAWQICPTREDRDFVVLLRGHDLNESGARSTESGPAATAVMQLRGQLGSDGV
jgi:hypothetical protein